MAPDQLYKRCAAAALLLTLASACSSGSDSAGPGNAAPTVTSTTPTDGATDVPTNAGIVAHFSEPMDSDTLDSTSFIVTSGLAATPVPGTVVYSGTTATFWPSEHLDIGIPHNATITTGAEDSNGTGLAENLDWSFTTGAATDTSAAVHLGKAGNFAILSKSGISTVPGTSSIVGDMGVSPIDSTAITEFALNMDASGRFSTSPQVNGKVYASDYAPPTPADLTKAISHMEIAFTDAAARAPDETELGAGSVGSALILPAGVYKWSTALAINADVDLAGSATDVWIFQIASNLIVASAIEVSVSGGALPENVFWQVSGFVDLDTTAHVDGIILSNTAIHLKTGASVNGRLLAQTAVTLDSATVTEPAQ